MREPAPSLAYHHVEDRWIPTLNRVTIRGFQNQLRFLQEQGVAVVPLSRLLANSHPVPPRRVVLTFDDAFSCIYHNAVPLLVECGFRAVLFVITNCTGRVGDWDVRFGRKDLLHMSWSQIVEAHRLGFEIGSHTHTHRDLTVLSHKELMAELDYSKKLLEDKIGAPVHWLSYPFGRYNARVIQAAREVGYQGAVTLKPLQRGRVSLFQLPRRGVYLLDSLRSFRAKISGSHIPGFEHLKLRTINFFSLGTVVVKRAFT